MSSANLSVSITSASPKPTLKPGQSIVVEVANSKILYRAVQEAAFAAGWSWKGSGSPIEPSDNTVEGVSLLADKNMGWCEMDWYRRKRADSLFLDARTQMGVLLDLLEEAKKPKLPPAPRVNGYEMTYTDRDSTSVTNNMAVGKSGTVKFGCAEISLSLLRGVKSLMTSKYPGNRAIRDLGLCSGVRLSDTQITEILAYVEAVNAAP